MAFTKAKTKTMPEAAKRGRTTDPEVVKAAEMVAAGEVITATGDTKLSGKDRETSARSEAAKVYNYATKKLKIKVTTAWVADEQAVYIGKKADKAA